MGTTLKTNDFMKIMKGRRSIRSFNPTVKISKEEMTEILKEATTAPASLMHNHGTFLLSKARREKKSLQKSLNSINHKFLLHLPL